MMVLEFIFITWGLKIYLLLTVECAVLSGYFLLLTVCCYITILQYYSITILQLTVLKKNEIFSD